MILRQPRKIQRPRRRDLASREDHAVAPPLFAPGFGAIGWAEQESLARLRCPRDGSGFDCDIEIGVAVGRGIVFDHLHRLSLTDLEAQRRAHLLGQSGYAGLPVTVSTYLEVHLALTQKA